MKRFSSPNQKIGQTGENIATLYLQKKFYHILERNYTRKWGEIDIVASKNGITHFVEVKSVSCENLAGNVLHETGYRPEEQVHLFKRARLVRIIETYIAEHAVEDWQFDVVCVYIDHKNKRVQIKMLPDIVL